MGREKVTERTARVRAITGSGAKLSEALGHKFERYEISDGTNAAQMETEITLYFSDEPVQQQVFTFEEQQLLWEAIQAVKVDGEPHSVAFDEPMNLVMERVFKNTYQRDSSE